MSKLYYYTYQDLKVIVGEDYWIPGIEDRGRYWRVEEINKEGDYVDVIVSVWYVDELDCLFTLGSEITMPVSSFYKNIMKPYDPIEEEIMKRRQQR